MKRRMAQKLQCHHVTNFGGGYNWSPVIPFSYWIESVNQISNTDHVAQIYENNE